MKEIVKRLIKPFIPISLREFKRGFQRISRQNPTMSKWDVFRKGTVVISNQQLNYLDDYVRQLEIIMGKIDLIMNGRYVYPYDPKILRVFPRAVICSITVDFGKVLHSNLNDLRYQLGRCHNGDFKNRELKVIVAIERLAQRISTKLNEREDRKGSMLASFFSDMLYRSPKSLDEAVQKLLFYNALFWQLGHYHIGLGRLDAILYEYYVNDIQEGRVTELEAKQILKELVLVLGQHTIAKSPTIVGDTGQYILLGGLDDKGQNIHNTLTDLFLDIFAEMKIPDPKLILRVNEQTSDITWNKTINCITTGIGSPLIMNEKCIMKKMVAFGYKASDVWNLGTSACWEPLIVGKSFDQNNPFWSAVAIRPLNTIIKKGANYPTFEELLFEYKKEYRKEICRVVKDIEFDCSPLFTLFFDDCFQKELDFTAGGAVYAYHGAQIVSFPNTINALLNIKHLVYDEKKFTLLDCKKAVECDFVGMEDFCRLLRTTEKKFGSTDNEVINITNDLMNYTSEVVKQLTCNGQPIKVGFSSPNYIQQSKDMEATLDGRKKGEPFAVHISPLTAKIDISEILDFASMLKIDDNCINGNVVDFILPSSYIKQSDKLVGLLKNACNNGIFEIQLNVMDKATLIDAKAHPEKYPNLVVRVWGFSTYFNDLPEEFKDNLIRRAEIYEAA